MTKTDYLEKVNILADTGRPRKASSMGRIGSHLSVDSTQACIVKRRETSEIIFGGVTGGCCHNERLLRLFLTVAAICAFAAATSLCLRLLIITSTLIRQLYFNVHFDTTILL